VTSSVWAYATNTTRSARKHKYAESRAKEMQSHYDRGTWDIVPRTEATNKGCKVYRCSFVDKMKVLEDGTCKAKSRLVCNQSTGKSFRTDPKHEARTSPNRETFAGCAQMTSFRLLVALAAKFNLELFNGDFSIGCFSQRHRPGGRLHGAASGLPHARPRLRVQTPPRALRNPTGQPRLVP
jgi:hypothetical protein